MNEWKKCSSCKKSIEFNQPYYVCSVSTCNSQRTGYVFCSVPCFERHLPGARHKDAAAIEERSPSSQISTQETKGKRRIITSGSSSSSSPKSSSHEILIVASKLKDYIKNQSGMNTSASVMNVLSDRVRALCDQAMIEAERDGRRTVMDRDF